MRVPNIQLGIFWLIRMLVAIEVLRIPQEECLSIFNILMWVPYIYSFYLTQWLLLASLSWGRGAMMSSIHVRIGTAVALVGSGLLRTSFGLDLCLRGCMYVWCALLWWARILRLGSWLNILVGILALFGLVPETSWAPQTQRAVLVVAVCCLLVCDEFAISVHLVSLSRWRFLVILGVFAAICLHRRQLVMVELLRFLWVCQLYIIVRIPHNLCFILDFVKVQFDSSASCQYFLLLILLTLTQSRLTITFPHHSMLELLHFLDVFFFLLPFSFLIPLYYYTLQHLTSLRYLIHFSLLLLDYSPQLLFQLLILDPVPFTFSILVTILQLQAFDLLLLWFHLLLASLELLSSLVDIGVLFSDLFQGGICCFLVLFSLSLHLLFQFMYSI